MAERQDCDTYLGLLRLAGHPVNDLKPVSRKIDIHLICGIVFHMADHLDMEPVLTDCPRER